MHCLRVMLTLVLSLRILLSAPCVDPEALQPGHDEPDVIGMRICGTNRIYIGELTLFPIDHFPGYSDDNND